MKKEIDRKEEARKSQIEFEKRFMKIGNKNEKKFALNILRCKF